MKCKITKYFYGLIIFLCFMPFMTPVSALMTGIIISLAGFSHNSITKHTSKFLQISIVLMGFGMNLKQVITASKTGFLATTLSVVTVMTIGFVLTKLLRVDGKTGTLISAGTAICGGSAIAAVAPVIEAENYQISFSLIVIFVLNAIALFIFPIMGHYFNLGQETFGTWAAIAIHDTSSVVGAGATYGEQALEVATTVKLVRALWIIPLTLLIAFFRRDKSASQVKIPWFILFFVLTILFAYFFPGLDETYRHFHWLGRRGMVISLFLIGSNISLAAVKKAGIRSFVMGIFLWCVIGISSLMVLLIK